MSDGILKTGKEIGKMKPINAMIFVLLLVTTTSLVLNQWQSSQDREDRQISNKEDREDRQALLEQIIVLNEQNGKLISNMEESEEIKKCVGDKFDIAEESWRFAKNKIGDILEENGIPFSNELNIALQNYDIKRFEIKDCLWAPVN